MTLLSDKDLAAMRAEGAEMLPSTVSILNPTTTADGAGGVTETWASIGSFPCRVDPIARVMQLDSAGRAEAIRTEYLITMAYNAAVTVRSHLLVDGFTYEIRQFQGDHSWRVFMRFKVSRVE